MATDSFKFWDGYWEAMQDMSIEERGELVTMLCQFVFDGEDPKTDNRMVRAAYKMVRRMAQESMEISARARDAGKRGGRPKKGSKSSAKSTPKSSAKRGAKADALTNRSEANIAVGASLSADADASADPYGDWKATDEEMEAMRAMLREDGAE